MSFSIDININFRADERLLTTLNNICGYLSAAKFIAEAPKENAQPPVEATSASQEPAAKAGAGTTSAAKEEQKADPAAKVSGKELVGLREVVRKFVKVEGGRAKIKAWLEEHKLERVPDMTNAQADEFHAFIAKEEKKDA